MLAFVKILKKFDKVNNCHFLCSKLAIFFVVSVKKKENMLAFFRSQESKFFLFI